MCGDSLPYERRCCTASDDDEFVDGLGCAELVDNACDSRSYRLDDRACDDGTRCVLRQSGCGTNLVGHVRRGKEPLVGDIEAACLGWCAGCNAEKLQRVRPPLGRALLEQPEAWDVLEEAVAAESTAFVGEIRSSRVDGDVGRSTLDTDQEPRAGRDERSARACQWTRRERARRVMGGDQVDGGAEVLAENSSAGLRRRQNRRVDADGRAKIFGPVIGREVEEPGRARIRALGGDG